MTRSRLRLSLGRRQAMQMRMALMYAIETFVDDDEPDEIRAGGSRMVREWEALRQVIYREQHRQGFR